MDYQPALGSPAPDFVYESADGARRQLSALWAEGPALILWLRHFG
jgi:hypothetical protein